VWPFRSDHASDFGVVVRQFTRAEPFSFSEDWIWREQPKWWYFVSSRLWKHYCSKERE